MNRVLLLLLLICISYQQSMPVAIFHGLGDACALEQVTGFPAFIKSQLPEGTIVKCFESGPSILSIVSKSFNEQAEQGCSKLQEDSDYYNKNITVIGLSQGGLIARYVAQKCQLGNGRVVNMVTLGGPHMGVNGIPHCLFTNQYCTALNKLVGNYLVYNSLVQGLVGPAGYYRDAFNIPQYESQNTFLATLNNENQIDQDSKNNFLKLDKCILIKFAQDTMIIPRETAWFQSFKPGTLDVQDMEDTRLYREDLIGLKALDQQGKVYRYEAKGDHLQITKDELIQFVINNIK